MLVTLSMDVVQILRLVQPLKEAYLASLPGKPKASLLVSFADKVDNAAVILKDYRVLGEDCHCARR